MTVLVEGEIARGSRVVLREKRLGDAFDDYRWRSDPSLARYDAARPFSATYHEYLALYQEELRSPNPYRRSLAIEDFEGRHIGNTMYYNLDAIRREAELGITIGDRRYWGCGYGSEALRLLAEYLLRQGGLERLHLKTLAWNERARRSFRRAGFVEYERMHRGTNGFILMELRREWLDAPAGEGASEPEPARALPER